MPRLSPNSIRYAVRQDAYLPALYRATRCIATAESDLRWIRKELPRREWHAAVVQRVAHRPLQYILGSQPFGALLVKCSEAALIPRWETEEWTMKLATAVNQALAQPANLGSGRESAAGGSKRAKSVPLHVVDACTGTGCIALSLAAELAPGVAADICAVDVHPGCLELARENYRANLHLLKNKAVRFRQMDVLDPGLAGDPGDPGDPGDAGPGSAGNSAVPGRVDLLVSNPPYIPLDKYETLDRSVKDYEPKIALVGDFEFYDALVENVLLPRQDSCHGFVFEVGNFRQIARVKSLLGRNESWQVGAMKDGAGNYRCAVGWKTNGVFTRFRELCSE